MTAWEVAVAAVELFRAEAELEVQEIEDVQCRIWKSLPKSKIERAQIVAKKWPWCMDSSKPPEAPPKDRISRLSILQRKELIDLLQVAPSEALRELYDQIHGGPQSKGWQHGVAELGLLLRTLFHAQREQKSGKKSK
jgi:hypothetical protein